MMDRSRSLSLKYLFCLPLKNEVAEESQSPVNIPIPKEPSIEEEDVVQPIQQVIKCFLYKDLAPIESFDVPDQDLCLIALSVNFQILTNLLSIFLSV